MIIPDNILKEIIAHSERERPLEACGYLAGRAGRVFEDYAMTNLDHAPDHFMFDPREQFAAYKRARQADLDIVAVYHSHPSTPARPSAEDIRLAFDPRLIYVIISLKDESPSVKSYRIIRGTVEEEPLVCEEEP